VKAPTPAEPPKNETAATPAAKSGTPAEDDGLQADERSLTTDVAEEKARKAEKDVVLHEAAHIVADIVDLVRSDTKIAARVLPHSAIDKPVD